MKVFVISAFLLAAVYAGDISELQVMQEWQRFKETYAKTYASKGEEEVRMQIFKENLERVVEHNDAYARGFETFEVAINEFSDLGTGEFIKMMAGRSPPNPDASKEEGWVHKVPDDFQDIPVNVSYWDWRRKGLVTPVKHQGRCGACWAFAAVGALEGQFFKRYHKLVSLSEQNLIDCSRSFDNNGCEGGDEARALEYVMKNGGIDTEDMYPYEEKDGRCRYRRIYSAGRIRSYRTVTSEKKLFHAVRTVGPVAVSFYVKWAFKHYKRGVFDLKKCQEIPNTKGEGWHAFLVVGYGSKGGRNYWIVKNSWGPKWGDHGYVYIAMGHNVCEFGKEGAYPVV